VHYTSLMADQWCLAASEAATHARPACVDVPP